MVGTSKGEVVGRKEKGFLRNQVQRGNGKHGDCKETGREKERELLEETEKGNVDLVKNSEIAARMKNLPWGRVEEISKGWRRGVGGYKVQISGKPWKMG